MLLDSALKLSPQTLDSIGIPTVITPWMGGVRVDGLKIEPRTDPALTRENIRNEAPYECMCTDDAVATALTQLTHEVLSDGFRATGGSDQLREFAVSWLASPQVQAIVCALVEDALKKVTSAGWGPLEVGFDPCFRTSGTEYFSPVWAKFHPPSKFAITEPGIGRDGEYHGQELVIQTAGTGRLLRDDERPRWMVLRYGSTDPYGRSIAQAALSPWLAKRFLDSRLRESGARSMGMMLANLRNTSKLKDYSGQVEEMTRVLKLAKEWGVLFSEDFDFDSISMQKTDEFLSQLNHLGDTITRVILTQNLSTKVEGGSFAAAETHGDTKHQIACSLARFAGADVIGPVWRRVVQLNFSAPFDDEDIPNIEAGILSRPNLEATKLYVGLGGRADGDEIARRFKIPLPPGEEGIILERPQGVNLTSLLSAGNTEKEPERHLAGRRSLADAPTNPEDAAEVLDALTDAAEEVEPRGVSALARVLHRSYLDQNPEPSPAPLALPQRRLKAPAQNS